MQPAGVTTDVCQAALLASIMNETGGLLVFDEFTYRNTPWERIKTIFGGVKGLTEEKVNAWRELGSTKAFDVAFFNWVYDDANRPRGYGLGNTQPGDGYRYRGMGPGALTGRGNYAWMARETGLPLVEDPEIIKTPAAGARLAVHFWIKNGCNAMVDGGSAEGALRAFRKLNAGLRDFSPHLAWWDRCRAALANDTIDDIAPDSTSTQLRRSNVIDMQQALVARGYNTGGIDGIVGPRTTAAILAFERSMNLPNPDGIVDETMLRALGLAA